SKRDANQEFDSISFLIFSGERIKSLWIVQDQSYMCALLHPSLKHFEIAPNEKSEAIGLVRQELLKRSSSLSNITATDPGLPAAPDLGVQ
ncbi:unnamed protein product, partial [Rotaria socialis]